MTDPRPPQPPGRTSRQDRVGRKDPVGRQGRAVGRSDASGLDEGTVQDGVVRPRPPGMRLARTRAEAHEGVEQEMLAEYAATLGRITAALEVAVAEWRRLDERPDVSDRERGVALDQVGRAAWHVLVQRESIGIGGDHLDWISRTHDVPEEALSRLGTLRVLVDDPAASRGDRRHEGIPPVAWHALRSRPPGG